MSQASPLKYFRGGKVESPLVAFSSVTYSNSHVVFLQFDVAVFCISSHHYLKFAVPVVFSLILTNVASLIISSAVLHGWCKNRKCFQEIFLPSWCKSERRFIWNNSVSCKCYTLFHMQVWYLFRQLKDLCDTFI